MFLTLIKLKQILHLGLGLSLTAKKPHNEQSSDDSFLTLQFRARLRSRKHESNDNFSDSLHGKLSKRMRASESSENDSNRFSNANNVHP